MKQLPIRIAHRGNTQDFPENTLNAFHSAFYLGANGIECDVQLDDKNNLIVVHNYTFDRKKTYPTLQEVLKECGPRGRVEIEIKTLNKDILPLVHEAIKKHSLSNYEITTSVVPLLSHIRSEFPKSRVGFIFRRNLIEEWMTPDFTLDWIIGHLELSGANVLHLDLDLYNETLAQELHKRGYILHTHLKTSNSKDWEKVKKLGIDQVTFDDPALLKLT